MTRQRKGPDRDAVFAQQASALLTRTRPAPAPAAAGPGTAGPDPETLQAGRPLVLTAPEAMPQPGEALGGPVAADRAGEVGPVDPFVWAGESLFADTGNAGDGDGRRRRGFRRG